MCFREINSAGKVKFYIAARREEWCGHRMVQDLMKMVHDCEYYIPFIQW